MAKASKEAGSEKLVPRLMKLPKVLWARIDDEWHRRKLASRTATLRVLLEEALK